jgi:hypothetical protein
MCLVVSLRGVKQGAFAERIGKLNRGLSVVDTAEIIKGSALTDDEYFKAAVLGWSVELVSISFKSAFRARMYTKRDTDADTVATNRFPDLGRYL